MTPPESTPAAARAWTTAAVALAVSLLVAFVAYRDTVASMVRVWAHSDTFAYGFFVAPVAVWLAWRSRKAIALESPQPLPLALIALLPLGLAWYVGRVASAQVVEQFAFVAMIPVLVAAHLGPRVTRRLAFPLAFLFFAVPFGDVFTPGLMDITAGFAEGALRLTGVPVARDGLYITTTTSRWHVIESCSGLRFTVAGVVLATLFGRLFYRSNWKRAFFVAMAVIVSILANGLRAYVLILVGHLTDLRRGSGLDHYAYGWLVFTGVMTTFFFVAARFREPFEEGEKRGTSTPDPATMAGGKRWVFVAAVACVLVPAGPAWESVRAKAVGAPTVAIEAPAPRGAWTLEPEGPALWAPSFDGAASVTNRRYGSPQGTVQCYIAYFANQTQGHELLHAGNHVADPDDPAAQIVSMTTRRVRHPYGMEVQETVLGTMNGNRTVWHWYWVPDEYTTSGVRAKWLQARATLLGHRDHAAVIVLSTTSAESNDAEAELARFIAELSPSIHHALGRVYEAPSAR